MDRFPYHFHYLVTYKGRMKRYAQLLTLDKPYDEKTMREYLTTLLKEKYEQGSDSLTILEVRDAQESSKNPTRHG